MPHRPPPRFPIWPAWSSPAPSSCTSGGHELPRSRMTGGLSTIAPGPLEASSVPRVSILTATYNRSNVLRLVGETVRRQTVSEWEWIVVGDACTDNTADVVTSFGDPRIRFVNLE